MQHVPHTKDIFVNSNGEFFKKTADGYDDVPVTRSQTGHPTVQIERFNWGHTKPCHAGEMVLLAFNVKQPGAGSFGVEYRDGNFMNLALTNINWFDKTIAIRRSMRNFVFGGKRLPMSEEAA